MRRLAPLLIAAGLALLLGGFLLLRDEPGPSGDPAAVEEALRPESLPQPTVPVEPAPTTTTEPPPVADPPSEDEKPITEPVELRVDALGIRAPIAPYGVDAGGQMEVPDNVTEVGWYRFGPKPGEPGSAVLAAHVAMAGLGPGVFYELDTMAEGDSIVVTYRDGSRAEFRVVARDTYLKDELPLDVVFSRQGPPVLTLITCGGGFNRSIGRYDSNVVVYAVATAGNEMSDGSTLNGDE